MHEVGICVPNLFLYAVVETAVRSLGARPVRVAPGSSRVPSVLVLDLEAVAPEQVLAWASAGVQILAFGPHHRRQEWGGLRSAGAVALPKSAFFSQLWTLLTTTLGK